MNKVFLKLSIRNIIKNRLNSIIITFSLALALSVSFIILSWAVFEYSYDTYHQNKDRIYRVIDRQTFKGQDEQYLAQVPEYLVNTFEEEIPGIENSTVLLHTNNFWISEGQENVEISDVYYSDANLFKIFSLKFIDGDPETCLSSIDNVVITKKTANILFGDKNPMGKTIRNNNERDYIISAVIEDIPVNSHLKFNMLLSVNERKPEWNIHSGNHNAAVYVLLNKGIESNSLKNKLRQFTNKHFPKNSGNYDIQLQALSDLHLNSKHTIWEMNKNKYDKTYVKVLVLMALLLLSISAINFFNLSQVSLIKRKKEIGIKKIIGSGKISILRQFLFENLIFIVLACVFAFIIIVFSFPYLQTSFFNDYSLADLFNLRTVGLCLGLTFFLVLVIGLIPLVSYSSTSPVLILSGQVSKKVNRNSFNQMLVISQLTITSFLIIATLSIGKQMRYIKGKDLGLQTEQVLILPTIENIKDNYTAFRNELLKNPNILNVSASNRVVGEDFWRNSIEFDGQSPDVKYVVPFLITDINFPEFYKMEIVSGRTFSNKFETDRIGQSYIINESLAKQMGYENPVGKKMRFSHTKTGEIIGVVKDFHFESLHKSIEPMAFYVGETELDKISVKVNSANMGETLTFIEKNWKQFHPNRPFKYQFLDKQFANLYDNDTKATKLVLLFTILAIILSSLGLFGLISFVAQQKTKEIGVRKVNGAKITEIMRMLSRDYFYWGIIGFGIACPIGYYVMIKWLQGFAYKTELSWWIFALSGILALGIALVSVSWQTWKAARKNPVEALRYE